MIITKNMLVNKGVKQKFLGAFDMVYPNGLDFSKPHEYFFVLDGRSGENLREPDLAKLFAYTGISVTKDDKSTCMVPDCTIARYNYVSGLLENFPNGDPAVACICNGKPNYVIFYRNGVFHNPSNRLPAWISWWEDGKVKSYEFFENNLLNDPYPGVPAYVRYDSSGKLMYKKHYTADKITAKILYAPDGKIENIIRYP